MPDTPDLSTCSSYPVPPRRPSAADATGEPRPVPRGWPEESLTRRLSTYLGQPLEPLALAWPDSANWLWRQRGGAPGLIKLARTGPDHDPFWHAMRGVFGADRWATPEGLTRLAGALPARLPIPPLPLTFLGRLDGAPIWHLPWSSGQPSNLSITFCELLGDQLGRLHQDTVSGFGQPLAQPMPLLHWNTRVTRFLAHHPRRAELGTLLKRTFPAPTRAVWCLPDMRADQYLCAATGWVWSDWEALVWAPIEFDWALVELLLETPEQRQAFMKGYSRHGRMIDLDGQRELCRALLWAMEAFGPRSYAELAAAPAWVSPRSLA